MISCTCLAASGELGVRSCGKDAAAGCSTGGSVFGGSAFTGSRCGRGGRGRGAAGLAGGSPTGSGGASAVVNGSITRGGGGGTSRLGRSTRDFACADAQAASGARTSISKRGRFIDISRH